MAKYIIGIGTSKFDGITIVQKTINKLKESRNITLLSSSKISASISQGTIIRCRFFNAAVVIYTPLMPDALWFLLRSTEQSMGRVRHFVNGPRTIDLDVLLTCSGTFKSRYLTIPHPRFFERTFMMQPAKEAAKTATKTLAQNRSRIHLNSWLSAQKPQNRSQP